MSFLSFLLDIIIILLVKLLASFYKHRHEVARLIAEYRRLLAMRRGVETAHGRIDEAKTRLDELQTKVMDAQKNVAEKLKVLDDLQQGRSRGGSSPRLHREAGEAHAHALKALESIERLVQQAKEELAAAISGHRRTKAAFEADSTELKAQWSAFFDRISQPANNSPRGSVRHHQPHGSNIQPVKIAAFHEAMDTIFTSGSMIAFPEPPAAPCENASCRARQAE